MQPAADGLARVLADTRFEPPRIPVVANVNCEPHGNGDTIRLWLTEQLTKPVRWQASMERLIAEGIEQFVEIGPGRVLTGLMRKIARKANIVNVAAPADMAQLKA
jgi:[acyl-carrier-protein] S-malonyltransferase